MKTLKEARELLEEVIVENKINLKNINEIMLTFVKKHMSGMRVANLFNNEEGSVTVETLTDVELLGVMNEIKRLTGKEEFNTKDYMFSNRALEGWEKGGVEVEGDLDTFVLENVTQISETAFLCPLWQLEEIYKARKNGKIRYNFESQREATYKTTKQGKLKRVATINASSVNEIANDLYNDSYGVPDMLTLNIPIYAGKEPNYLFEDGKLTVGLNGDFYSDSYTVIDSVDGEHRQLGTMKAVAKAKREGRKLNGGFPVLITLQTVEEARNFIARKAKGNPITNTYAKIIESNDYSKVSDELNQAKSILQNNIGITYEEMLLGNKLTNRNVIVGALKQNEVAVNKISERIAIKNNIITVLNVLEDLLEADEFVENKEKLLGSNTFSGYVAIAEYVKNNNKSEEWIFEVLQIVNKNIDVIKNEIKGKSDKKIVDIGNVFRAIIEKIEGAE